MTRRFRRPPLLLSALLLGGLALAFVYRSRVEQLLAPAEPDFTPAAVLAPAYPRPGADLPPIWKVELEEGYGGAAIEGDDVFVLDREPGVADTLRVLDLETGTERWTFTYEAPGQHEYPGSRTRPVVVGDLVYLCGSFGHVHCVDRRTRSAVWSLRLDEDCGGELPEFGWAASPLVHDRLVILPALGADVGLVGLDRFTGDEVWRTPAVGYSHSTPATVELLGEAQVLFLASDVQGLGSDEPAPVTISAFEPGSGSLLWCTTTLLTSVPIPPPVRVDDEHIFVTGGYGGGSTLLRIRRDGGEYTLEEVFHIEKGSQIHPPVVHEKHIYLLANENSNESRRRRDRGGLTCLDMTGSELWRTGDDPYFGRGHMMLLGDYILIQDGQSGILRLCLASPRGYSQLATANVFESPPKARRRMWAPMARSGGTLVVRGRTELRCVRLDDRRVERR